VLRITQSHDSEGATLKLEGKLAGPWVAELERCWRELSASEPKPALRVRICSVSFVDEAGQALLQQMFDQGVALEAEGCLNKAIVARIRESSRASRENPANAKRPKKLPGVIFWLFLAGLFLGGAAARAQGQSEPQAPEPPKENPTAVRLTLDRAVALALKQNPQVLIAVLNAAQGEQDYLIARAALLPQATLNAQDAVRRGNLEANLGARIPVPGFPQHFGPFQFFQAGPQVGMPLFDLTLWRRWQAAREGVAASRAESQSTREQILLLVVSQYLASLRSGADVKAAESRVELAQALYNQAADLQKEGVGTGIDTLRANVELQNEKQRLIQSQAAQKTQLYGLSRLLNLDPRQSVELGDEPSFFETPEFSAEQTLAQAYSARPEMKALEARTRASEAEKRAVGESRLPSLRFDGFWAVQGISAPGSIPAYQYQVSLGMPLFTGGRIHAQMAKADLELKKFDEQRADLRNQIALEVKTAMVNLDAARHEVEVAELGVKLAREEVTQARDRFAAGVVNNIEVISAQDSLARANDNQIAALYRFNQARADLARSTGQMETLYTK
jgi:outer membrane protein